MKARSPRLALATVVAEGFLGRLAFGMVSFAFPLYAFSLGLPLAQIGVLVSLRAIVTVALKPPAGWLADRLGVRAVYLLGALGRVLAAAGLLVADGFVGLMFVRLLLGASAAGRDVASLGVIARDAERRVGTVYSWYASAKHVGGVAGAGAAGLLLAAGGGAFETLFVVILALSVLPMAAAWLGLREVGTKRAAPARGSAQPPASRNGSAAAGRVISGETVAVISFRVAAPSAARTEPAARPRVGMLRELAGPASVGMLVATAASMVHGIFPILATEHAGLNAAEAGLIYSLSAAVFLVAGPAFGWLIDHGGRRIGLGWRAAANIGSSLLYLASPTFAGLAVARSVDDSGKAAFRPAWASAVADIAAREPARRGQRLGLLDTSQSLGEALGPALAGLLWQSGGIVVLFAVRIVIAVVAEVAAIRTFGELHRSEPPARAPVHAAEHDCALRVRPALDAGH